MHVALMLCWWLYRWREQLTSTSLNGIYYYCLGQYSHEFLETCAEETLWSGGPSDWNNPKALEALPQVRELVKEGKYAEATSLSKNEMLGPNPQVFKFEYSNMVFYLNVDPILSSD